MLKNGIVSWPGNPPARISHAQDIERGDPRTVSLLEMDAHTGTHMDASAHFLRGGVEIDPMPPDAAIGSAPVIPIRERTSIKTDELLRHKIQRGERVLFKTYNSEHCSDSDSFFDQETNFVSCPIGPEENMKWQSYDRIVNLSAVSRQAVLLPMSALKNYEPIHEGISARCLQGAGSRPWG